MPGLQPYLWNLRQWKKKLSNWKLVHLWFHQNVTIYSALLFLIKVQGRCVKVLRKSVKAKNFKYYEIQFIKKLQVHAFLYFLFKTYWFGIFNQFMSTWGWKNKQKSDNHDKWFEYEAGYIIRKKVVFCSGIQWYALKVF